MFRIDYRIVHSEYDFEAGFLGEEGFIQISCNGHKYGEMYGKEIEQYMGREYVYDWLYYFMQSLVEIKEKKYAVIRDIETDEIWIEIQYEEGIISTSIIKADKVIGTGAIEFSPRPNTRYKDWKDEKTSYEQFKNEIKNKAAMYYDELCKCNSSPEDNKYLRRFKDLLMKVNIIE